MKFIDRGPLRARIGGWTRHRIWPSGWPWTRTPLSISLCPALIGRREGAGCVHFGPLGGGGFWFGPPTQGRSDLVDDHGVTGTRRRDSSAAAIDIGQGSPLLCDHPVGRVGGADRPT